MKPTIKVSEKSRILVSKDYSMFEFPDFKVSSKHMEEMKSSIQKKNLLPDYPILVDDKYSIIEGRYRFLACYDLRLPVYYKIAEVTELKDAISIKHIHKNIHFEDVVNMYASMEPYGNILKLKEEVDLSIYSIILAIDELRFPSSNLRIDRKLLDSGELQSWNYSRAKARLLRVIDFRKKYGYFNFKEALTFVGDGPKIFNKNEKTALEKTPEFQLNYSGFFERVPGIKKRSSFFDLKKTMDCYELLLYCAERGVPSTITAPNKAVLAKLGID